MRIVKDIALPASPARQTKTQPALVTRTRNRKVNCRCRPGVNGQVTLDMDKGAKQKSDTTNLQPFANPVVKARLTHTALSLWLDVDITH